MLQLKNRIEQAKPLKVYKKGYTVKGGGKMSLKAGYEYTLEANPGSDFDERFKPFYTPAEMLEMGVFEGKYLNDCTDEFPKEWFKKAAATGKLSPTEPAITCNYFVIKSRQPLQVWEKNGWLPSITKVAHKTGKTRDILADAELNPDERGWFQWYCRYWLGRRIQDLDNVQIGRWRSFARHAGAVKKGCTKGDLDCRKKERQALLQWSYDPFI